MSTPGPPSCLTSQDRGTPPLCPPPEPVSTRCAPHSLSCPPGVLDSYPTSRSPPTVGGTLSVVCMGTAGVMCGSFHCLSPLSPQPCALSSQQGVWCPRLGTPASSSCLSSGDVPPPPCGSSPPFPFSRRIFPSVFLVLHAPPDMETCPFLHRPLPGAYLAAPRAVPSPPTLSSSHLESSGVLDRPHPYLTHYTACFLDSGDGVQPDFSPCGCRIQLSPSSGPQTPGACSPGPDPPCFSLPCRLAQAGFCLTLHCP